MNFLGVKIPTNQFPTILHGKEGSVEPIPIPANWHADIAEWAGVLLSVDQAVNRYRIVELGCGWGCWLNNAGAAAKMRGLVLDLVGIEGDASHVESAHEILQLNGFDESEFKLVHGIAAPTSGYAYFPQAENPGDTWGGEPVFVDDETNAPDGSYQRLRALTLADLSDGADIDLLHIDIQGGEVDFVDRNMDQINRLVKRVLVGTHSREIEGKVMRCFLDHGWTLEIERPALMHLQGGKPAFHCDGVQVWRSPHSNQLSNL